jgi:hypothetical protein
MSVRLSYKVSGDFAKITGDTRERLAKSATAAMKGIANDIKIKGRAAISSGMKSGRFASALQAKVYPSQGASLHPTALVYHKITYAGVFEDGATITGKPMLWLPIEQNLPGGKRITPAQFVASIGALYSMRVHGKPMLGAVIRETDARSKKAVSLSLLKKGRNPGGRGTVRLLPVFVGITNITDPKKFDIEAIAREATGHFAELFSINLEQ